MEAEDIREEMGFCPLCQGHKPCGCDPRDLKGLKRSFRNGHDEYVEEHIETS